MKYKMIICSIFIFSIPVLFTTCTKEDNAANKPFKLWATACSHVTTDSEYGYESLSTAIRQSEVGGNKGGPGFDWDIMLHLGNLMGGSRPPADDDGREVVRQLMTAKKHRREHVYNITGNHDASGPDEPIQWWFQKWIDPTGKHVETSKVNSNLRPYPITGTWERYYFQVGNILFLMMSDRNDDGPPAGRGKRGGFPAGKVTLETFRWWVNMVEQNPDKIIITCHHHLLKNTTVATGKSEGAGYHGQAKKGAPEGAPYLYFAGDVPDAQLFENYLESHPNTIDIWLGGHTHTNSDDTYGNKSHIERKWDVTFINVAALTRYHVSSRTVPMSRLLTFKPGSKTVNVACYLHTSDYAPQGWYSPAERTIPIRHKFNRNESAHPGTTSRDESHYEIGGITLKIIPRGKCVMGNDHGDSDEKPSHSVMLDGFLMSATEITQAQYRSVMGGKATFFKGSVMGGNASFFKGDNLPMENINWKDTIYFCNKLSETAGLEPCYNLETWECDFTKNGFRIPTEAEWEYACCAVTRNGYFSGKSEKDPGRAGWYKKNSSGKTHRVGQREPNGWGLYDMHGNVWEWCNDIYDANYYNESPEHNPTGPQTGHLRVKRGGCFSVDARYLSSSYRVGCNPYSRNYTTGFRIVRQHIQ